MFELAIDSKLRGCDVVALGIADVAAGGYAVDRAMVRQKKTGRPVSLSSALCLAVVVRIDKKAQDKLQPPILSHGPEHPV
jgi:hypothetical protein